MHRIVLREGKRKIDGEREEEREREIGREEGEKRNRNIWRIINLLSETQIERTDIKRERRI